jgi:hypothetical protein
MAPRSFTSQNLLEGRTLPTTVEFLPKKGARLVFDLNLSSYAGSRGASVLRNASGLVRLRVAVRSSPILGLDGKPALLGTTSVNALTGGRPTTALVLLRGSVLCAATLLERETAITAAPCVKQLSSAEQRSSRTNARWCSRAWLQPTTLLSFVCRAQADGAAPRQLRISFASEPSLAAPP